MSMLKTSRRCYSIVAKQIPQSTYVALANRIKPLLSPSLVQEITKAETPLETLGNAQLGYYVGEHLFYRYPNIPTRSLKRLLTIFCGKATSASIANELGMSRVVDRDVPDGLARATRALVGGIYTTYGKQETKQFIKEYFLSREYDISKALRISNPKYTLTKLMEKQDSEPPISRLISETGRKSRSPVFVVGVFSGEKMLGEAYGSSIAEAEQNAAKDALQRHYLLEVPVEMVPSAAEEGAEYVPPLFWTKNGLGDDELNL